MFRLFVSKNKIKVTMKKAPYPGTENLCLQLRTGMISREILCPADALLLKITNQDGDIFKGHHLQ